MDVNKVNTYSDSNGRQKTNLAKHVFSKYPKGTSVEEIKDCLSMLELLKDSCGLDTQFEVSKETDGKTKKVFTILGRYVYDNFSENYSVIKKRLEVDKSTSLHHEEATSKSSKKPKILADRPLTIEETEEMLCRLGLETESEEKKRKELKKQRDQALIDQAHIDQAHIDQVTRKNKIKTNTINFFKLLVGKVKTLKKHQRNETQFLEEVNKQMTEQEKRKLKDEETRIKGIKNAQLKQLLESLQKNRSLQETSNSETTENADLPLPVFGSLLKMNSTKMNSKQKRIVKSVLKRESPLASASSSTTSDSDGAASSSSSSASSTTSEKEVSTPTFRALKTECVTRLDSLQQSLDEIMKAISNINDVNVDGSFWDVVLTIFFEKRNIGKLEELQARLDASSSNEGQLLRKYQEYKAEKTQLLVVYRDQLFDFISLSQYQNPVKKIFDIPENSPIFETVTKLIPKFSIKTESLLIRANEIAYVNIIMGFITIVLDVAGVCILLLTGGRALQMNDIDYPSDDSDFVIVPKNDDLSNEKIKFIAFQISKFLKFIVPGDNSKKLTLKTDFYAHIQVPNDSYLPTELDNEKYGYFMSQPVTRTTIVRTSIIVGDRRIIPIIDIGCGFNTLSPFKAQLYRNSSNYLRGHSIDVRIIFDEDREVQSILFAKEIFAMELVRLNHMTLFTEKLYDWFVLHTQSTTTHTDNRYMEKMIATLMLQFVKYKDTFSSSKLYVIHTLRMFLTIEPSKKSDGYLFNELYGELYAYLQSNGFNSLVVDLPVNPDAPPSSSSSSSSSLFPLPPP